MAFGLCRLNHQAEFRFTAAIGGSYGAGRSLRKVGRSKSSLRSPIKLKSIHYAGAIILPIVKLESFWELRPTHSHMTPCSTGGVSQVVPTFPLLWPFSSPFLSIGLVMIGGVGLGVL